MDLILTLRQPHRRGTKFPGDRSTPIGAVLAALLAGIASAIGVSMAYQAGAGVLSEDPDKFSRVLVFQALPGTQAYTDF